MATANFEYTIQLNRLIYFTDKSVDAISWKWTIDGNEYFDQYPTYTYDVGGPKEVTLLINEGELDEDEITRTIHVPTFTEYQNTSIDTLRIRSFPPEVTYQWYKIVDSENFLIEGATSRVYDINSVSPDNQGDYFCRVSNIMGDTDSDPATLTVHIKPYFYDVSESQSVGEGNAVILHAYADGLPTQLYYQWYKGGEAISEGGKYSGTQTDELTIDDFSEDEEGNYTCLVTNDLSHSTGTDIIILTMIPGPFSPDFWTCSNGFSFSEAGIIQEFNDVGDAYAVYHVPDVANLVLAYTCAWKDGTNFSSSGAVCYNGIGLKPVSGGAICEYPAGIDGIGAYGAWQLKTNSCFSSKTVTFIGRNNEFSAYYSGCILDADTVYVSNISISVGPHKGANLYDVTVHLVIADASIDETHIFEDIYFQDGEGQIMIGGLQCGTAPAQEPDYQQHITQLDILLGS